MTGVKFVTVITNREYGEHYLDFFVKHGVTEALAFLACGTAERAVLDAFGLEKTEKAVFNFMIRDSDAEKIKNGLISEMKIMSAGAGIAVFVTVDGLGGETAKNYMIGEQPILKEECRQMENGQSKYVMINVIADKGNTDAVMEAARSAGATGGTVVRAKGTGAHIARFFGVSISEEKEIVYIVAKRTMRDAIMRAVMEKAGKDSDAHGVVFSIPVDCVLGISALEEQVSL